MSNKKSYYILDNIGYIGSQKRRSAAEIQKDNALTAKAIKKLKQQDLLRPRR